MVDTALGRMLDSHIVTGELSCAAITAVSVEVTWKSCTPMQWRSYTRAHTGPGPGEFLSALVNHARSTYLNRNSVAVYGIMSCRIKLPMPLRPGKLDLLFRISHLFDLRAGGRSFVTSKSTALRPLHLKVGASLPGGR